MSSWLPKSAAGKRWLGLAPSWIVIGIFMLIPMLHNVHREVHGVILCKLAEIVDAGALKPLLDEPRFALADVGDAYDRLSGGQATGKVVIEIAEE